MVTVLNGLRSLYTGIISDGSVNVFKSYEVMHPQVHLLHLVSRPNDPSVCLYVNSHTGLDMPQGVPSCTIKLEMNGLSIRDAGSLPVQGTSIGLDVQDSIQKYCANKSVGYCLIH